MAKPIDPRSTSALRVLPECVRGFEINRKNAAPGGNVLLRCRTAGSISFLVVGHIPSQKSRLFASTIGLPPSRAQKRTAGMLWANAPWLFGWLLTAVRGQRSIAAAKKLALRVEY
jgi:hypothetical protein